MQTALTILVTLFAILSGAVAQSPSPLTNVTNAFKQARIVPDVLSSFSPSALLNFNFSSLTVLPGELLSLPQTTVNPSFALESNNSALATQTFVVAIIDPDAGTNSQVRHFLGGNFVLRKTGGSVMTLVNTTSALSEYRHPAPPPGGGPHRYISLAYIQPPDFNQRAPLLVNSSTPIIRFNVSTFATAANLGNPIAGNFFLAANNTQTATTAASASTPSPSNSGSSIKFVVDSLPFRPLLTALLLLIHSSIFKYL